MVQFFKLFAPPFILCGQKGSFGPVFSVLNLFDNFFSYVLKPLKVVIKKAKTCKWIYSLKSMGYATRPVAKGINSIP